MTMEFWQQVLAFADTTTQQVGAQLLKDFGQVKATEKSDGSLITRCDRWADDQLRAAIADAFPDHGILSEEVEHIFPSNDWVWIIDPIDGTTNFAMGVPVWAISLGLLYRGTPVFGYVYVPPLNQAFHGFWAGTSGLTMPSGAFLNRQPIQVSDAEMTDNHLFSFCTRSISTLQQDPNCDHRFPCKIRMIGVATYNLLTVAMGAVLGAVEATPKVWDIAAMWAILHAAGATWVSLNQQPIFPLTPGQNYRQVSFPSLVVAQTSLLPIFQPWVATVGQ